MDNKNITNRKFLTNVLLTLPYAQIITQYNAREFFRNVFAQEVDEDLIVLRELLIEDFYPDKLINLSRQQRDAILYLVANADNNLQRNLQTVLPIFKLPQNFDINDYRTRASQILNGMLSIRCFIAEEQSLNFLADVMWFSKLSSEKLNNYSKKSQVISQELAQEHEALIEGKSLPKKEILERAIAFIGECGRMPLFTSALKEKLNLGEISEIILKLDRAILIAIESKKQKAQLDTPEDALFAIKNYLIKDIHL